MKINSLLNTGKTLRISSEWNGETFWFEAKTTALSPKFLQRLKDAETQPIEIAAALAEAIADWEGAEEFPPTADNLALLPVDFLTHLLDKLTEVWQGNGQKPSGSASGSAAAAK